MFAVFPYVCIYIDVSLADAEAITSVHVSAHTTPALPTVLPPVLAMTANTSLADITNYKRAGFTNVLGKPFDMATLRSKLLLARVTH